MNRLDRWFQRRYWEIQTENRGVDADDGARQRQRYGSLRKTTRIDTVNWLLLVVPFAPLLYCAPRRLLGILGYQAVGLVINGALSMVRLDKRPPLSPLNRLWL